MSNIPDYIPAEYSEIEGVEYPYRAYWDGENSILLYYYDDFDQEIVRFSDEYWDEDTVTEVVNSEC